MKNCNGKRQLSHIQPFNKILCEVLPHEDEKTEGGIILQNKEEYICRAQIIAFNFIKNPPNLGQIYCGQIIITSKHLGTRFERGGKTFMFLDLDAIYAVESRKI